jgi:predicted AlkP superfamily pyrophosphatase or phosphodiesterase
VRVRTAIASALLVCLAGCDAGADVESAQPPAASSTPAFEPDEPGDPVVLVVSVDALNPEALTRVDAADVPAFEQLRREGASTDNARTAFEETNTLPNHTTMMTGIRVDGPRGHGVDFNEDDGSELLDTAGRYVPGIFDVAHDAGLSTALLTTKEKFELLERSWDDERGAPDRDGADDGRDKLDTFLVGSSAEDVVEALVETLPEEHTDLTFLHLAPPDVIGHEHGFMSSAYLDAVRRTDRLLGKVLSAIEADGYLRANTTVILTADHGGQGAAHTDEESAANYTVPFYVWGAGVERGADLYELNPGRRDPGTDRVGYRGAQPVRNMDVAALALATLGLPPVGEVEDPLDVS